MTYQVISSELLLVVGWIVSPNVVLNVFLIDYTKWLTKSCSISRYLSKRGPINQHRIPFCVIGKFLRRVVSWEQLGNYLVGNHKDKVSEGDLVAGEIALAGFLEILIEHPNSALDRPFIAVDSRLDMLWVFV